MVTIAIVNQKGGVGKTCTAAALGAGLALKGLSILYVDLDAQQNLSFTLGADPKGKTIADLLQQAIDLEPGQQIQTQDAIQHTPQGDIIASSASMAGADTILADITGREYKLREILEPVQKDYAYCIVDTPPTLGTLTINALTAAQAVIAPAQAEVYSEISLGQLYNTIKTVQRYCNPELSFSGIVLTRYNGRAVVRREVADRIDAAAAQYGTRLYKTRIRECTALQEAALMQQSIFTYAPRSNAARDYAALAEEVYTQLEDYRIQRILSAMTTQELKARRKELKQELDDEFFNYIHDEMCNPPAIAWEKLPPDMQEEARQQEQDENNEDSWKTQYVLALERELKLINKALRGRK